MVCYNFSRYPRYTRLLPLYHFILRNTHTSNKKRREEVIRQTCDRSRTELFMSLAIQLLPRRKCVALSKEFNSLRIFFLSIRVMNKKEKKKKHTTHVINLSLYYAMNILSRADILWWKWYRIKRKMNFWHCIGLSNVETRRKH